MTKQYEHHHNRQTVSVNGDKGEETSDKLNGKMRPNKGELTADCNNDSSSVDTRHTITLLLTGLTVLYCFYIDVD